MRRFLLLIFLFPLTAGAWTRTSDYQIADRAARLAPIDLNLIIKRYHKQYAAGIDYGIREESTEEHRAHLRERIEKETRGVIGMLHSNQPMAQVVARLGLLSHLVGDANNPFHVDVEAELESSHDDFERYFERRMLHFPTVFYGLDTRFDDRSTAFGVASICYSHAITDLVNLYYYIWEQSGGDVRSAASMRTARVIPNAN
jgi:hypothetical protein